MRGDLSLLRSEAPVRLDASNICFTPNGSSASKALTRDQRIQPDRLRRATIDGPDKFLRRLTSTRWPARRMCAFRSILAPTS
jgi:hypothetical protein